MGPEWIGPLLTELLSIMYQKYGFSVIAHSDRNQLQN